MGFLDSVRAGVLDLGKGLLQDWVVDEFMFIGRDECATAFEKLLGESGVLERILCRARHSQPWLVLQSIAHKV
jgi:hypothetical protein